MIKYKIKINISFTKSKCKNCTLAMKSLTVHSSSLVKASVCVTAVIWFKLNLKQNSSNSFA